MLITSFLNYFLAFFIIIMLDFSYILYEKLYFVSVFCCLQSDRSLI